MKQTSLKIQLLGPVVIKFDDKSITINRRIERAILYILAIEHKPVTRTKLIDLLWPDANQSDPRASLRTALSRLRKELPDSTLIITELDHVRLDTHRCDIDLVEFAVQYRQLRNILSGYQKNRPLPASLAWQIQKAVDLWRGDNIISGDDLSNYPQVENWKESNNRKFYHQRKVLIDHLAHHYRNLGQLEKALNLFIQLAKLDNSDVYSQCAALDIFLNTGRLKDAINYCDTLENIYEHEFNAPLPDEIINRCQQAQIRKYHNQNNEEIQWPIPLTMHLEMVGRNAELSHLIDDFHRGGLVLIRGEMGSGKTRLVKELFLSLFPRPFLLSAPSREMEANLPFSPIIHCLRQGIPRDIWGEIDGIWVKQLSLLLPELASFIKHETQTPFSRQPKGTQQIFDALLNVFVFTAKKYGRVLFFLDDAQWADVETLQALSYLISNDFFDKHGLLIIASRSEEKNPNLNFLINLSYRSHQVESIQLTGLSLQELNDLVKQLLNKTPSKSFINKLHQETSGNPFLALEIIRHIQETQDDHDLTFETKSLPLPTNVHALIHNRFEQLEESAQHILRCAAVLGNNISPEILQSITEVPQVKFSRLLGLLLESGIIFTTQKDYQNGNLIHFAHQKMREVILKETSAAQLQIFHRQAADLMANNSNYKDKPALIANHYLMAEEKHRAFNWFLKAAEHAWTLGAKEETLHAYQQAEQIRMNSPKNQFDDNDILQLYQQWGEYAYQSGQVDLLEQISAKLQYYGERGKNRLLIGISQILFSNACFLRLDFETALDLICSAIEKFESINNQTALIKALRRKSVFCWWTLNYKESENDAQRILELIETTDLTEELRTAMEFNGLYFLTFVKYTRGEAISAVKEALTLYNNFFHRLEPFDRLKSLFILAHSNFIAANYDACKNFGSQALEIAELLENPTTIENIQICLSKTALIQGNLDSALNYANQALKSAEKSQRKHNIIAANSVLGNIFYTLQDHSTAAQHFRIGQIREGFTNVTLEGIENSLLLANLLAWTEKISEARELLNKYSKIIEGLNLKRMSALWSLTSGICDSVEGDLPTAEVDFCKGIQMAEENGLMYELIMNKIALAKLMLSTGELDRAQTLLNETLEVSKSKGMVWLTVYALDLLTLVSKAKNKIENFINQKKSYENLIEKIKEKTKSENLNQILSTNKIVWYKN